MPYPLPSHPRYCASSEQLVVARDLDALWHRCPGCSRLVAAKPSGRFFPHFDHPTRLGDRPRETLHRIGYDRRHREGLLPYPGS